ncbi:hypothetical protein [Halorubrum sp. DTA46]|uniref:hypothetical protein n=1 Tax=Halorubrum sp. DTA46 TaxID=3402162 RepID=UPI003AAFC39D
MSAEQTYNRQEVESMLWAAAGFGACVTLLVVVVSTLLIGYVDVGLEPEHRGPSMVVEPTTMVLIDCDGDGEMDAIVAVDMAYPGAYDIADLEDEYALYCEYEGYEFNTGDSR